MEADEEENYANIQASLELDELLTDKDNV